MMNQLMMRLQNEKVNKLKMAKVTVKQLQKKFKDANQIKVTIYLFNTKQLKNYE